MLAVGNVTSAHCIDKKLISLVIFLCLRIPLSCLASVTAGSHITRFNYPVLKVFFDVNIKHARVLLFFAFRA